MIESHKIKVIMKKFDVFVIGTGVSGTAIATACVGKGFSVGIADKQAYGGTCATRGCIPKKVMWGVVHVADAAKRLNGKGIDSIPTISWPDMMSFKDTFVDPVAGEKEKMFEEKGIATFHGVTRFISPNQLQVGDEAIEAKKIIIATGAKPANLNIKGAENLYTSDDFLQLKTLPKHILFIGGGYISFEFAHIAARCGSKVTIVHNSNSPLKNFEPEMVELVTEESKRIGINLVLNSEVEEIIKAENSFKVITQKTDSKVEFITDLVINSSGREPAIADLDLEKGNVVYTKKGIEVNSFLQSVSNANIYAAGDVAATNGLPLTPLATMEANIVSSHLGGAGEYGGDYSVMPFVVFTEPPLASVGFTETEALDKKLKFDVNKKLIEEWFSAKRVNSPLYAFKILIEKKTDKLLGAHLAGPHAEETINLFAMAMRQGVKAAEIKKILFTFPSSSSDISSML